MSTFDSTILFNASTFAQQLKNNPSPLALFQQQVKQANILLEAGFRQNKNIKDLITARSEFMDALLKQAWQHYISSHQDKLSLIAVGGYGRKELFLASDIDLLILVDSLKDKILEPIISPFIYFLMDFGVKVGYSVRTIKQCVTESKKEVTIITNLIESRLICGAASEFNKLTEAISTKKIWPADQFYQAKMNEQQQRYQRYDDTSYNLEPNIKESPGGLRDIQMIGWVINRHFNARTLNELVQLNVLKENEYQSLTQGQQTLWKIRFALHILAQGQSEDRLLFSYQPKLAEMFDYKDNKKELAVEQFMQAYYRTVKDLNRLQDILLAFFQEEIFHKKCTEITPINTFFQIRNHFIEAVNSQVFQIKSSNLLEIFSIIQKNKTIDGISADTIRLIREYLHLIDDNFRKNEYNRSIFMEIFRQPNGITHALRTMNRHGVLAAYLPVFSNIVGRMQFDLFHTYTVDEHSLFVVRNIRRMMTPEFSNELKNPSAIAMRLQQPELLYLAGLFHDIAKGRGGDHSKLGAVDAYDFCILHGLNEEKAETVAWLVRNHLIMSTTSQKADIDDPDIIIDFSLKIKNQERLDYLYLLTIADIRATNPELWDAWKAVLLAKLYNNCTAELKKSNAIATQSINKKEIVHQYFIDKDWMKAGITNVWSQLETYYIQHCSSQEIIWHIESLQKKPKDSEVYIDIQQNSVRAGSELLLYTSNNNPILTRNRFPLVTTILDRLNLTIIDARMMRIHEQYNLDIYLIFDHNNQAIDDKHIINNILQQLNDAFKQPEKLPDLIHHWIPKSLAHHAISTQVGCKNKDNYTLTHVITTDHAGLLAKIARIFQQCDINVHEAKIVTFGARAEDVFMLTYKNGKPLTQEQCANLHHALYQLLDVEPF